MQRNTLQMNRREKSVFGNEVLTTPAICTVAILLLLAGWIETRTKKIPNWLSLLGLTSGIVLAALDQLFLTHACGFLLGFMIGVAFFISGFAGGGAAKLMMAVGAIIGPAAPIASGAVLLLIFGYCYSVQKFKVPVEIQQEGKASRRTTIDGSLVLTIGTVIGIVLLSKPWK